MRFWFTPRSDPDHGRPYLVFRAARPDIDGMRQALAEHGCFLIRGLFDPVRLRRVRERALIAAQAWEFMIRHGYATAHEAFAKGAYLAGHLPQADIDYALTQAEVFEGTRYDVIATGIFGEASHGFAVRRSSIDGSPTPLSFHQDAFFVPEPGYNFWTPLNDAGVEAPGLEVVLGSGPPVLSHAVVAQHTERVFEYIRARYGQTALWHPLIRAGDVLVFTTFLFHRTHYIPTMQHARYSLEIRGRIQLPELRISSVPSDRKFELIECLDDILTA